MINGCFEIDSVRLRKAAEDLEQQLNNLKSARNDIAGKMGEVETMWEGPAKEAFQSQYELENLEFTELCDSLDKEIKDLYSAATEYEMSDGKVRNIVDAIRV